MMKTETKTKAASLASFVGALLGLTILGVAETDYVPMLPDAVEAPVYAAILAAVTWLGGYARKHAPDAMSESAIEAVRKRTGEAFPSRERIS